MRLVVNVLTGQQVLDFGIINIPFGAEFIDSDDNDRLTLGIDLLELGVDLAARCVHMREDGTLAVQELYVPYESIPTNFTGIAVKVFHAGIGTFKPCVQIKGSPAKFMQGHNVFGSESLELGLIEMLAYFQEAFPVLYGYLYPAHATVSAIDVTYSAKMSSNRLSMAVIEHMRRVEHKHTRLDKKRSYDTTVYWGTSNSRHKTIKLYLKHEEFNKQLKDLEKKAKKHDPAAQRTFEVMSCPKLQDWTIGLCRFEVRLKDRWLHDHGVPTGLYDLIKYQKQNLNCLPDWWKLATKDIFEALGSQTMKFTNDDDVYAAICSTFVTVTPTGRRSTAKANNLFNFYCALREHGSQAMKKRFSDKSNRYYGLIADLIFCGLDKAHLLNLHATKDNNIIKMINIINVDFATQRPPWYVEAVSRFPQLYAA
jgi:II/X family phage/plasmid replication protein